MTIHPTPTRQLGRWLDAILVFAAAVLAVLINFSQADMPLFAYVLAPVLYLVLAPMLTRADLPSVAGRVYLLCFFTSLLTAATWGGAILQDMAQMEPDPQDPLAGQRLLLSAMSRMLPEILLPLGMGIVVYATTSVFEPISESPTVAAGPAMNLVDELSRWLTQWGAAPDVVEHVRQAATTVENLEQACGSLSRQAAATQQGLAGIEQIARQSEQALAGLQSLRGLEMDLVRVSASVDQLAGAVTQMGQVMDELSEIISRKILEL
jgi:hypothetical protein